MINELIAYLTHPDGTKIQVLSQNGKLDSDATHAAYEAYSVEHPFTGTIEVFTNTRNPEVVV